MNRKYEENGTIPEAVEPPIYLSHDHSTSEDAEDALDRMAMDSFPASDPPSYSSTAVGTPLRSLRREPMADREGRSATGGALLRDLQTIAHSSYRIARARMRGLRAKF